MTIITQLLKNSKTFGLPNNSYQPITNTPGFVNYKKGLTIYKVLLAEETEVPRENHQPVESH
jgi:hypothetical protein